MLNRFSFTRYIFCVGGFSIPSIYKSIPRIIILSMKIRKHLFIFEGNRIFIFGLGTLSKWGLRRLLKLLQSSIFKQVFKNDTLKSLH